ncbi:MAG: 3-isopropylmalate dehydratase small subunit [Bacteroidetes bacterium QS_8_64_10]|nr:MAG: 3-isopropylmalate dehydratase small subunit [Bacteroidetes bacterium QS_8_64_10]
MSKMQTQTVTRVAGPGVAVRGNDIDTDQVIPARFMKEVTFDNMGQYAFFDARRDDSDAFNDHPFNQHDDASILVVNQNFGCGSSREHAPQALMRWGIEGIVGESFAEIFAGNCQALGIPTATASHDTIERIMERVEQSEGPELTLDVESETVMVGDEVLDVRIKPSQKEALLGGIWDTTSLMKSYLDEVQVTADNLPYLHNFGA